MTAIAHLLRPPSSVPGIPALRRLGCWAVAQPAQLEEQVCIDAGAPLVDCVLSSDKNIGFGFTWQESAIARRSFKTLNLLFLIAFLDKISLKKLEIYYNLLIST